MKMKKYFVILVAAAAVLFGGPPGAGGRDPGRIPVTYRLKWIPNVSTAGELYAKAHGYFEENGLDVEIKAGGPGHDPIKELELGRAHFGVASADQVIRALSKGARVAVISQLFQVNPLQWIYRPDKTPIAGPDDLRGKTIGVTYGGIDENIMRAVLAKYGIRLSEVSLYSVRYDFTPFYRGEVDLWPLYRNAQGPIIGGRLESAGEKIGYFNPESHGIHTVANSVITAPEILHTRPEIVDRFLDALHRGWEAAMEPENSEKTVAIIHKANRNTPVDIIRRQLAVTRRFVKPEPTTRIGRIDVGAWRQTEKMMLEQGLVEKPVGIDRYLKDLGRSGLPGSVAPQRADGSPTSGITIDRARSGK